MTSSSRTPPGSAHRDELLRYARGRTRTDADAEDAVQLTLTRALVHQGELLDPRRERAWLFRILRNVLTDQRRAAVRDHEQLVAFAAESREPEVESDASCACSLGVLAELPSIHQGILQRAELEDATLREVAVELGISENAAKVRLHRARQVMRRELARRCGTDSLRACLRCTCNEQGRCGVSRLDAGRAP